MERLKILPEFVLKIDIETEEIGLLSDLRKRRMTEEEVERRKFKQQHYR